MSKLLRAVTMAMPNLQNTIYQPAVDAYQKFQFLDSLENEKFSPEVIQVMMKVDFFSKSCPQDLTLEMFTERCMRYLKYEIFHPGKAIFHIGDKGDKFYIILKGAVDVFVPRKEEDIQQEEQQIINVLKSFPNMEEILDSSDAIDEKILRKAFTKLNIPPQEQDKLNWRSSLGFKYFTRYGVLRYFKVVQLRAGKSFGEVALNSPVPRTASIIATEETVLLSLTKTGYNEVFQVQIRAQMEKHKFIQQAFKNIGVEKIPEVFSTQFKEIQFNCNRILWKEEDLADQFMILIEGSVTATKKTNSNRRKQILICQISPGGMLGHVELMNQPYPNQYRQTNCITTQSGRAYVLTSDQFRGVLKQHPYIFKPLKNSAIQFEIWVDKRIQEVIAVENTDLSQINNQFKQEIPSKSRKTYIISSKSTLNNDINTQSFKQINKSPTNSYNQSNFLFEFLDGSLKRDSDNLIKNIYGSVRKINSLVSQGPLLCGSDVSSPKQTKSCRKIRIQAKQSVRGIARNMIIQGEREYSNSVNSKHIRSDTNIFQKYNPRLITGFDDYVPDNTHQQVITPKTRVQQFWVTNHAQIVSNQKIYSQESQVSSFVKLKKL